MKQVEYIGTKPHKVDNVAHSGVVWMGQGDVQEVEDSVWHRLKLHTEVWRLAPVAAPPSAPVSVLQGVLQPQLQAPAVALQPSALEPAAPPASSAQAPQSAPTDEPVTAAALQQAASSAQGEVAPPADAQPPKLPDGQQAQFVLVIEGSEHVVLDTMDDVGLKAFAVELEKRAGLNIDMRKKGDKLREAIVFAWNEKLAAKKEGA